MADAADAGVIGRNVENFGLDGGEACAEQFDGRAGRPGSSDSTARASRLIVREVLQAGQRGVIER